MLLEARGVTKTFPGVKALEEVSFCVAAGEIHGLVGENGAGKSTLMKVLSGVHPWGTFQGDLLLQGESQRFRAIADSERAGIAIIHQELALVPELTIYENLFLGHEVRKGFVIDWNETIRRAMLLLKKVRLDLHPGTKVRDLGVGQQQLVEIAKALGRDVKVLILDEPTAALNEGDCDNLLDLVRGLKQEGVTCVLISHKLKEVLRIADRVTVLRDGRTVCTLEAGELSEGDLIRHMVGRELAEIYPRRNHQPGSEKVLEVSDWQALRDGSTKPALTGINFNVKRGEIVGFAGLMGSGRTELARSLFGNPDGHRLSGALRLNGTEVRLRHPGEAIRAGLAYASEDRKGNGLILTQDVKQNITLANLRAIAKHGIVDALAEVKAAEGYRSALAIKTPSVEQRVSALSGGTQQKVSVAKWLFAEPRVLILDEPTRGIDVGARFELYTLMNTLVAKGMSILLISSELAEVLGMSDRVYVMSAGRIAGELASAGATQEQVMHLATRF